MVSLDKNFSGQAKARRTPVPSAGATPVPFPEATRLDRRDKNLMG